MTARGVSSEQPDSVFRRDLPIQVPRLEAVIGRVQFRTLERGEFQRIDAGRHVAPDPVGPDELVDTVLDARRAGDRILFGTRLVRRCDCRPRGRPAIRSGAGDLREGRLHGVRVGRQGIETGTPAGRHGRRVGDVVGEEALDDVDVDRAVR